MIKNLSKCMLRSRYNSSISIRQNIFECLFNRHSMTMIKSTTKFSFSSNTTINKSNSVNHKITESELNKLIDYVVKFKPKTVSKSGDAVVINIKKLKGLNENNKYTVFQSKGKYFILKNSLIVLVMGLTLGMILYLTFSWFKNEYKIYKNENRNFLTCVGYFVLFGLSAILSIMFMRNYRYRVWKFIKRIEVSRDLKKLQFTTLLNKKFEEELSNVYLYYNYTPSYNSVRTMTKVNDTLIVGIKKKIYVISFEDADVPDIDLFACCVRGYDMKAL